MSDAFPERFEFKYSQTARIELWPTAVFEDTVFLCSAGACFVVDDSNFAG